jgi:four helix bundle suffix protein
MAKRLRPSGGYRQLHSFQAAIVVYDATVAFCERFVEQRSRLRDQMTQAARSGRQNIAEGSRASATSSQTELRLVNVARASLDELLLDYEDFLRQRGFRQWAKDDPEALEVRACYRPDPSNPSAQSDAARYSCWLDSPDPAVVANAVICLIHQANYLLDQQTQALERGFIKDGGYSERLAAARIAERQRHQSARSNPTNPSDSALPNCPLCGKPMALRTARKGARAGKQFWGCSGFPTCRGALPLDGSVRSVRSDRSV